MYQPRIIPCLLLHDNGLVKTKRFKNPVYIGDPVNAVRIFSEKEVDELVVLDIDASMEQREPNYELVSDIAGESFMPIAYGGGVTNVSQIKRLIRSGVEKVAVNTAAAKSTDVIHAASKVFGSQAIIGAIDVKKTLFGGYAVVTHSASVTTTLNLEDHVTTLIDAGVGEIFLNNVDQDGMMKGYDIDLIRRVASVASVPVVACGGAGSMADFDRAIDEGGASAVAAGSMFVFHGKRRGVLINYPKDCRVGGST